MKIMKIPLVFIFLFSFYLSYSQVEVSGRIEKPGQSEVLTLQSVLIGQDLSGPYVVKFYGESLGTPVSALSRKESSLNGSANDSYDKLKTLFSGEIYSPEIDESTVFKSKTPEELSQMEIEINPYDFGEVPPNIHGTIASRLVQIQQEFPPEFVGNLFGKIMSRIAKIHEKDCKKYFNRVFEELAKIRSEGSPEFPQNIYDRVVEEIIVIQGENCQSYNLFLHLEVRVISKSIDHVLSDDAGKYNSVLKVNCELKND